MRSQLIVFSAISIAVAGCGKSVERSANPVAQTQNNGTALEARTGNCVDPIETNYKLVENFSDIEAGAGTYKLVGFDAVGTSGDAISVLSVIPQGPGYAILKECHDLSSMPRGKFSWGATAPKGIDAKNGRIERDITVAQTVFGDSRKPVPTFKPEAAKACGSATEVMDGAGCVPAQIFQIDSETIGVYRVIESTSGGLPVQSKIFARYKIVGGEPKTNPEPKQPEPKQPEPKKPEPKKPHPKKPEPKKPTEGNGTQGKGMQGKGMQGNGTQGTGVQGVEPKTVVVGRIPAKPAVVCCKVRVLAPKPVVIAPKTISIKTAPEGTTQIKLDVKEKSNEATGVEKKKVDLKVKQVTEEGTTKIKYDAKEKSNARTGVEKSKSDLKIKQTTDDGSTKVKVKIKRKVKTVKVGE